MEEEIEKKDPDQLSAGWALTLWLLIIAGAIGIYFLFKYFGIIP